MSTARKCAVLPESAMAGLTDERGLAVTGLVFLGLGTLVTEAVW
jgi:hypothetical protein